MGSRYEFHLWKYLPTTSWEDVHVEKPDNRGMGLCGTPFPNHEGCVRYYSGQEVFELPLPTMNVRMCPECKKRYKNVNN